jgi:hypothetical protein
MVFHESVAFIQLVPEKSSFDASKKLTCIADQLLGSVHL